MEKIIDDLMESIGICSADLRNDQNKIQSYQLMKSIGLSVNNFQNRNIINLSTAKNIE